MEETVNKVMEIELIKIDILKKWIKINKKKGNNINYLNTINTNIKK